MSRVERESGSEFEPKDKGVLLVLTGPTGVGKDTVMKALLDSDELDSEKLVTYTSREKRPNEKDGWDYNFVTKEQFETLIDANLFLEYIPYGVNPDKPDEVEYKGTLKSSILKIRGGKTVIWRINMGAAADVHEILREKLTKAEYESIADKVVVVLMGVNSLGELKDRVIGREGQKYNRGNFIDRLREDWGVWKNKTFPNIVYNEPAQVDRAVSQILELIHEKQKR